MNKCEIREGLIDRFGQEPMDCLVTLPLPPKTTHNSAKRMFGQFVKNFDEQIDGKRKTNRRTLMLAYMDLAADRVFALMIFLRGKRVSIREARVATTIGWTGVRGVAKDAVVEVNKVPNTKRALRFMTKNWRGRADRKNIQLAWDFRK